VAILNATNQSYTSPPATLADNGDQFTVVVSNRLNSANVITSTVARVSVLIPNNLTWYPQVDFTTWDTATANWTTNGGISQANFATGNNVTFDALGYNDGGNYVTVTNVVNPNSVTFNIVNGAGYAVVGDGISGQSLLVTGDGTGDLYLALTNENQYSSVTITNAYVQIGYSGTDGVLQANVITNNGTLQFDDAGLLPITATLAGTGVVIQDGTGTTVLSATNSVYTIQSINQGTLSIASTPGPGPIVNNGVLIPASAASVLVIPNAVSGSGLYDFIGFQTTVVTGVSSHTGANLIFWPDVIVNNPAALGDPNSGSTIISGADRFGGLYLSNSIVWTQPLELDTRYTTGQAATAPHIANFNGTNDITGALTFDTGSAAGANGTELNVEATTGQLTIDAASSLVNGTYYAPVDLNLQGAGVGLWNGVLTDAVGGTALNVLKRGTGNWTLGGPNTYSGNTTVTGGTLLVEGQIGGAGNVTVQAGGTLGGSGSIAGPVTVATGGTLAPGDGLGTLTVNANLTLSAGSTTAMEISKAAGTNATITGIGTLTYGGTLVITNAGGTLTTTDTFPLFSATTYAGSFAAISPATPGAGLAWNTNTLTTDGTLRIAVGATVNTNPTNITSSVKGSALTLSWPADHTGWRLEVQTNGLAAGLSSNTNYWATVPGSTTTNSITITIISTNPAEFYRMVYP
jgi:autotransporter-associated beta strand protein